jgi:hypothetical protein
MDFLWKCTFFEQTWMPNDRPATEVSFDKYDEDMSL